MSIQEWGAIGEVVGGVAVVLSLLYLASQIRQSTKTAKASSRQSILDKFYDAGWDLGKHPHLQRALALGLNDFDSLSNEDKSTFAVVSGRYAGNLYNALLLRKAGLLDPETLRLIGNVFVSSISTPGGHQWWQIEGRGFYPQLQEYVDTRLSSPDAPNSLLDRLPFWRR
jgi:hypothetical protein